MFLSLIRVSASGSASQTINRRKLTKSILATPIVVFGATGYTGRLVAERLVAQGERPVLAGRDPARLAPLAERLGGLEWREADAGRQSSVYGAVRDGEVLVATVGPFTRYGEPAVRAALAAGATYLDSTGEPAFVRRVFEEFGAPAARSGAALLPALGYDYVPGTLAGALALEAAGQEAVRVDVGYFAPGTNAVSAGTAASAVEVALGASHAFRDGRLVAVRPAERVRGFRVRGGERPAISLGGAEHFALPAVHPALREVNVYLGWFGELARPLALASLGTALAGRVPGVRGGLTALGRRAVGVARGPRGERAPGGSTLVVGEAFDGAGTRLADVTLVGPDPYALTAGLLAWAAVRAARAGVQARGALGPLEAFGLEALQAGALQAGLRVSEDSGAPR